jgi:hypothetical protein
MAKATLEVPSLLREFIIGAPGSVPTFEAGSLAEVLPAIRHTFPKLAPHVWDETGELRQHVHVYVGEWNVRWPDVPDDAWHDGVRVRVTMAVSGG